MAERQELTDGQCWVALDLLRSATPLPLHETPVGGADKRYLSTRRPRGYRGENHHAGANLSDECIQLDHGVPLVGYEYA